jgi:hypothetical protein
MASYLFKELDLCLYVDQACNEVTWKTDIRAMPHIYVKTQSLQVGSIAVSKWKRLTTCPFHGVKLDFLLRNFIWELNGTCEQYV